MMAWRKHIKLGAMLGRLTALGLAVLACSMPSADPTSAQNATAEAPARVSVHVPTVGSNATAMLELAVKAVRDPGAGNLGGVVRIRRQGGNAVEVGRFSIFPAGSFTAANASEERRFQFDVTSAIRQLDLSGAQAEVEVALIDRSSGKAPSGAALTVSSVHIVLR